MFIRPILICAAGAIALQLLTVRADATIDLEIPKGWSASDSLGKQYFIGYDSREKAYFIANAEPIEPAGRLINAETVPSPGGHHVPYSGHGLKDTDPWAAALLQSIKAGPYRGRKLRLEAEVKSSAGFNGQLSLMLRATVPDGVTTTTTTGAIPGRDWQTVAAEIGEITDDGTLDLGFLLQGEGRVLIRNVKLTSLEIGPKTPRPTPLQDMFDAPRIVTDAPVNLELSR